jgi:hypothetical protein
LAEEGFGFIHAKFPCMNCRILGTEGYAKAANGLMFP